MIYHLKIPTLASYDGELGDVFHYDIYIEAETFPTKAQVLAALDKLILQEPHEDYPQCKKVIDAMKDVFFEMGGNTGSTSTPYNLAGRRTYYMIESISVQKVD